MSGSVGYAVLNLKEADENNRIDVEGWNRQGISIGPFPSLASSPFVSARASYRYSRDFGVALSVLYFSKQVTTSYNELGETLDLKRSVGSTDIALGISYYPPARPFFMDWFVEVDLSLVFARAGAEASGTRVVKVDGEPTTNITIDTKARYRKSKLNAAAFLGMEFRIAQPLLLRVEGGYKFAQLGKLDGDVTRFGETRSETTSIGFNYSGMLFTIGIGIEL